MRTSKGDWWILYSNADDVYPDVYQLWLSWGDQGLYLGYGFDHLVFNFWAGDNKWAQVYTEYGNEDCILPRWIWCSV